VEATGGTPKERHLQHRGGCTPEEEAWETASSLSFSGEWEKLDAISTTTAIAAQSRSLLVHDFRKALAQRLESALTETRPSVLQNEGSRRSAQIFGREPFSQCASYRVRRRIGSARMSAAPGIELGKEQSALKRLGASP
jgi:hypothetical protein